MKVYEVEEIGLMSQRHCIVANSIAEAAKAWKDEYGSDPEIIKLYSEYVVVQSERKIEERKFWLEAATNIIEALQGSDEMGQPLTDRLAAYRKAIADSIEKEERYEAALKKAKEDLEKAIAERDLYKRQYDEATHFDGKNYSPSKYWRVWNEMIERHAAERAKEEI